MITAHGSERVAVAAMKQGAYDYLQKPFEPDEALLLVRRAAERKHLRTQARQHLDLVRELERGRERGAERDLAVVGHEAGVALLQALGDVARQRLRAEGGVGRAADRIAAGHRDHVMEGGNLPPEAGQRRGEHGMRVHHGADLGTRREDGAVEAPFARRLALPGRHAAVELHEDDVGRLHVVIGHARRRHEHAALDAEPDISRPALIDPERVHPPAGVDDAAPLPREGGALLAHRFA